MDFVTIHILPYWEDFPIRARYAAGHVDSIRKRMAVAFPNKEILIGETGWPSAGRMRKELCRHGPIRRESCLKFSNSRGRRSSGSTSLRRMTSRGSECGRALSGAIGVCLAPAVTGL